MAAGVLRPPRHNIQSTQRNIRTLQGRPSGREPVLPEMDPYASRSAGSPVPASGIMRPTPASGTAGMPNPAQGSAGTCAADGHNTKIYRILNQLGIDLDLSVVRNQSFIKDLVGECFALQTEHNPAATATSEYRRPNQHAITYAISLCPHASKDAYERYQRRIPYCLFALNKIMDLSTTITQ